MYRRSLHLRVSRWLVGLSLAMYACAGLFGHALHDFLPCSDEACAREEHSAAHRCCDHDHKILAHASSKGEDQGPKATRPGHDADRCSLCTLLAKIAVGRVALYAAELNLAAFAHEPLLSSITLHGVLDLSRAPRGPPLV